ncbi:MAG: ROK family protein [Candidatus Omnitrophica bacterium]|nr:ROK family protein [Candidatus Omnitrophota bacterium]
MSSYVIGVDVGGTNVKLGIVNPAGKLLSRSSFSTKLFLQTPEALIDAIAEAVLALIGKEGLSRKEIAGVGIGLPGLIDVDKGVVRLLPNIPGWADVALKRIMEKKLGLLVQLENDVNMITLGEWEYGAGKGIEDLICMTLGTGVGAGLILNNRIYHGPGFAAGEIGHVPLNEEGPECGCGGWGCFERYVGNKRLQKEAAELLGKKDITLEDVYRKAVEGKKKAVKCWEKVGERVGNGLIGPVNMLNPECVIIGGGVARSFDFLKPAIEKVIKRRCMKTQAEMVRVIRARLDDDAGIIGAQVLICHENKN